MLRRQRPGHGRTPADRITVQLQTDGSYVITTMSREASVAYRVGVDLFLRGSADARTHLRRATQTDPTLAVAAAALALAVAEDRNQSDPVLIGVDVAPGHGTRRERQHVEILALATAGNMARARALAAEHLGDFPEDRLVRYVLRGGRTVDMDKPH
jgi:hypothetical protein